MNAEIMNDEAEIMNDEDELVVKLFDYKGKSYYIDAENVIYDFISLDRVGRLIDDKIIFGAVDERIDKLFVAYNFTEALIDKFIRCRDKWLEDAEKKDEERGIRAFGIRANIHDMEIGIMKIEKLIYKSLITNKRELLSKYKEKYLSYTQQELESWETLIQMGAEGDGKYLLEANRLKESYDHISYVIAKY
jgi:hypothetical protein